jgi:hypothetical protein
VALYQAMGFTILDDGEDAESGARFGALAMRRDHSNVGLAKNAALGYPP